jgi:hypothetical protein
MSHKLSELTYSSAPNSTNLADHYGIDYVLTYPAIEII